MAFQKFKHFTFKGSSKVMIHKANEILNDLRGQGYTITLRQLYYALVSQDIIANKQSEYKRLGSIINNARLAGLIDWDSIEDRTRNLKSVPHWKEPSDIIKSAADSFRMDKWATQDHRIEVWVEKDALVGILERACRELDVPWFSCRGYTSQSELYGAGMRMNDYIYEGKQPIVIHLGDHDPSGKDMTRDIEDRLFMFVGSPVEVKRIALNWNQIEQYSPPPNPAKVTDSRFEKYAEEFGEESWELDALDVRVIHEMILEVVKRYRDEEAFEALRLEEEEKRSLLAASANNWHRVAELLQGFEDERTAKIHPIEKTKKPRKK